MSRGILNTSDWERYVQEFPDFNKAEKLVHQLPSPDILSIACSNRRTHESLFPVASICFNDVYETLWGANYALAEIIAHGIWYLSKTDHPNTGAAALFGRFYAEDAVSRLYSAGEHLANGIIMMFEINDGDLKPFRNRGKRISQQSIVGNYLREKKVTHPITKAILELADSKEWQAAMKYRNRCVHEQPPSIKGLGIIYKREIRWKTEKIGKRYILLGGGDKPEHTIDDLIKFIKPAVHKFIDTFVVVMRCYESDAKSYLGN